MIIKYVTICELGVAACGGCSMGRRSVSVELKHAVTQKSTSLSMVDGMSKEQEHLQSDTRNRSCLQELYYKWGDLVKRRSFLPSLLDINTDMFSSQVRSNYRSFKKTWTALKKEGGSYKEAPALCVPWCCEHMAASVFRRPCQTLNTEPHRGSQQDPNAGVLHRTEPWFKNRESFELRFSQILYHANEILHLYKHF